MICNLVLTSFRQNILTFRDLLSQDTTAGGSTSQNRCLEHWCPVVVKG